MGFLYNIITIAKYERKILLRSWFFRIFAILSLFVIGMYSGATLFDKNPFTWMFRSLPSALIYSNMFLLNIFQSIIAVFLATDFMKRDKKMNTSEVLFIRPMTNTEYITGKTLGLLMVFIILNLLVILLTTIFLLISPQVELKLLPILLYFLLMSIPTLVFITGISFALMGLIKNQPVTFVILLGYIALVLFYLGDKANYLFDYMTFQMPLAYSDIIGFSNIQHLLVHRISYFILGLGFLLFTAWRLNRLPNNAISNWLLGALSFVMFVVSTTGFYSIYSNTLQIKKERAEYVSLSASYFDHQVPDMLKASIHFYYGKELKASSLMTLKNNTGQTLDTLFFSINPGLQVENVEQEGNAVSFTQNQLLVSVVPNQALLQDEETVVTMHYSGVPDMNIAYLDNTDEDVFGFDRAMTIRIDRQYGFYNQNYVLLTKECLWYPIPGIAYDPSRPAIFRQQFTRFDLTVTSRPGMLPVSQGKRTTSDSLTYHFDIRDQLPQLSLNIGHFKERKLDIGDIEVGLAFIDGHDNFSAHFSELNDTITDLILEFLDDYERPLGLFYPYPVFTVVEVPAQFSSLPHSWTSALANSQPQKVFFPERGFNVSQADFSSSTRRIKRDSERNKEGLTEMEIQTRVFTSFLRSVFTAEQANMRFGPPTATTTSNPYNIFPNYFYHVNYITSDECPVLNYAFESYLMKGQDNPRQLFMARNAGIGDNEQANLLLKERSLKQIIAEEKDQQAVKKVLRAKGSYLLTWIEKEIDDTNFDNYLLDYLYDNSYKEIGYEEMIKTLSSQFNVEMENFLAEWYNTNRLPAFGLGEMKVFETIDRSQSVFVVRTKVTNYSDVDGLVKFTFQLGEGRRGGGGGFMAGGMSETDPEERIYLIEGGKTKKIQMVMNESPRSLIFNTMLSQNIPSSSMTFGMRSKKLDNLKAEEYEIFVDQPVELIEQGALIIDNKDAGFSTNDPALENPLRKLVEQSKKKSASEFTGEGFGQAPSTWRLSANSDYFGKIEHSAMVIRSGDGSKTATWRKELPTAGYYEIFVHLSQQRRFGRGRGNSDPVGKYSYTVFHDDGQDEIELEVKDFENGWNLLGSFYLSGDTSKVILSDKGGADRVVADAVKWVQQR